MIFLIKVFEFFFLGHKWYSCFYLKFFNFLLIMLCLLFFFLPSLLISSCGDGIFTPSSLELCDDGNKISGDGCDSQCQVEKDFKCTKNLNETSLCFLKKPFSAFLEYVPLSNPFVFNLSFSKPMIMENFSNPDLFKLDVPSLSSSFEYRIKEKKTNNQTIFLEVSFNESFQNKVAR